MLLAITSTPHYVGLINIKVIESLPALSTGISSVSCMRGQFVYGEKAIFDHTVVEGKNHTTAKY